METLLVTRRATSSDSLTASINFVRFLVHLTLNRFHEARQFWPHLCFYFFIYKIIESREMKDESKDPDTIDGAVRVAQLVNRSSFKETLGFLIIFVILVYLLKRLLFR